MCIVKVELIWREPYGRPVILPGLICAILEEAHGLIYSNDEVTDTFVAPVTT